MNESAIDLNFPANFPGVTSVAVEITAAMFFALLRFFKFSLSFIAVLKETLLVTDEFKSLHILLRKLDPWPGPILCSVRKTNGMGLEQWC